MGWTSKTYFETTHEEFSYESLCSFLNEEINKDNYRIIIASLNRAKSIDDHHVVYCLIKHPEGYYFGEVILIDIVDKEIFWKEISCSEGPNYYDCPKEILNMISRDNKYSRDWIEKCSKRNISILNKRFLQSNSKFVSISKTKGKPSKFMIGI